jgi:group I intron endonuclease
MIAVYLILNTQNDKAYIGQTKSEPNRWRQHKWSLNAGKHHCTHLQRAWNEYGAQAFEFLHVVSDLTQDEADDWEQKYIQWFAALGLAYNPTWNHKGRGEVSTETREKMRQNALALGLKPPSRKGCKMTTEQRAAHRERMVQRWADHVPKQNKCPDCNEPIAPKAVHCVVCSRKYMDFSQAKPTVQCLERSAEVRRGRPLSTEHKQKQSAALKGRTPANLESIRALRRTPVCLVCPEGHTIESESIAEFCREHALHRRMVGLLLNGKIQQYKGWTRP